MTLITKLLYRKYTTTATLCIFLTTTGYLWHRHRQKPPKIQRRSTEKIFLHFASVEYKGQVLMTPLDFLDSVTYSQTRVRRARRAILNEQMMDAIRLKTPIQKDSQSFFSRLKQNGIITYSEFLFLLTILRKPYTAFRSTFDLFDTDYSGVIDRNKFLMLERILSRSFEMKKIDDDAGLLNKHQLNSTILVYFFGRDGTQTLSYDNFKEFLQNVQQEVLELEFLQFSHGLPHITEVDFAKLLLRYTDLDESYDYDDLVDRLLKKQKRSHLSPPGISFSDVEHFAVFLHKLEELYFIIRYSSTMKETVTRSEFHSAFKLMTGSLVLSSHLIDTIFDIFDVDDCDCIVYKDFLRIINQRMYGGFRQMRNRSSWGRFKKCVKQNLREDRMKKQIKN